MAWWGQYLTYGEVAAAFDTTHFVNGLNGDFVDPSTSREDRVAKFEGLFESADGREIAAQLDTFLAILRDHGGLGSETVVADVGAGTGLLLKPVSQAAAKVVALEISPDFREHLRDRVAREGLEKVEVRGCTATAMDAAANSLDLAFMCDVYHHLEYPRTFCRALRTALRPEGRLVVLDFYRDESKMSSMSPGWVTAHLRAGQEVFRQEILDAGFDLVAEPDLPELKENYVMVFKPRQLHSNRRPGAGWASAA